MKKVILLVCIFLLIFTMSVCAEDRYEDCRVEVIDNTAWIWVGDELLGKIYDVKDACVTQYIGSSENVVLTVDKNSDLVERRYRSAGAVTSKTIMENVHSVKKDDGRIYIQTRDGRVFERVYSNLKVENIPCDEKTFENTAISVYVDGKLILPDCEPYIKNDRTMVPMRAIFEALGASVKWYQAEHIATGTKGDIEVAVKIGDRMLYKNGEGIILDATAEIKNNRTMVPVRAISEAFGCSVTWDNKTKSVIVEGIDKAWDYTYLADKAEKATIYWKTDSLTVAETGKLEDKATIKKLLQFLADSKLIKKEYDGIWYESGERRSFSVYAKESTISVEIGKEEILINAQGKISCYEVYDMTAFKQGIREIFGMDDKDKRESVFYKHFGADVKDEIAYFCIVNKSVENESFVMTVREVAGNAENMYITVSIKAKGEENKAYITPGGVYGQIDFDIWYNGAVAIEVFAGTKQKWIEEDEVKVFLYKLRKSNYRGLRRIKANCKAMMGEDIYFDVEIPEE